MPRIVKRPDIRRAEILDTAFEMFVERGYDNVSLNDMIADAGLSKGMFYHHFASKEALLEALFDRITQQAYAAIQPAIEDQMIDAATRLMQMFTRFREHRLRSAGASRAVLVSLFRTENREFYRRIEAAWAERMRPIMTQLIGDGISSHVFETDDPEGAADLILQMQLTAKYLVERGALASSVRARNAAAEALDKRITFQTKVMALALGMPAGALSIGPPDFARKYLKALNPNPGKPVS